MMKRQSTAGLSQLELMLALLIMGIISVLLANTLTFSGRVLQRADAHSAVTAQLLARHELRDLIENIPPRYPNGTAKEFLSGSNDTLRFKSFNAGSDVWSGAFSEFELALEVHTNISQLVLVGRGLHPATKDPHTTRRVVAENVMHFRLTYFGYNASEQEKRWHDTWSDDTLLPELIKVEWATNAGIAAPPLTFQPAKTTAYKYMSLSSLVPPG